MTFTRYFIGLVAGLCGSVAFFAAVFFACAGVDNYRLAGLAWTVEKIREREHILDARSGPALIIVAGSSGLFGIDGAIIAERSELPVINASTHAALSWQFIDRNILHRARPGDTVLLPLEIPYFMQPPDFLNETNVEVAHTLGLDFFWSLSLLRKLEYVRQLSISFLWGQIESSVAGSGEKATYGYYEFTTDAIGDIDTSQARTIPHQVQASADNDYIPPMVFPYSGVCGSIKDLGDRGVKVIGTPSAIYLKDDNVERYRALLPQLARYFSDCGATFVYDKTGGHQHMSAMYDTVYHLTKDGRRLRTELLAAALCDQKAISCRN